MNRCKFALTMGGSLVMGLAGVVNAADAGLEAQVAELQKEVAALKGQQTSGLLDQRRAEEIKGLIRDVLSDADTRASLLSDGAVGGHDGRNFFWSSVDGSQRLTVWGQVQFRYIFNLIGDDSDDNQDEGFEVRRAKLGFGGHVTVGRKFDYEVVIAMEHDEDGLAIFEDVKFGTQLTDSLRIDAGHFKLPFLREELISSKRQLTVERSSVNEFFTLERNEQIQLSFKSDMIKFAVSLSDGAGSGESNYSPVGADGVEFAVTGRIDVKIAGDWTQAADTSAWSGQPFAFFLGAAAHYQGGDEDNGNTSNYFTWTIDGSIETGGLGVFAAFTGGHTDPDGAGADPDQYGFVVQASYNINDTWEPFVRGEWIDDDLAGNDEAMLITAGFNYYIRGHDAKFTLDVVWFADGDLPSSFNPGGGSAFGPGLGFSSGDSHGEDDLIIRAQFQLLF